MVRFFLLLFLFLFANFSLAHPTEHCLALTAQAANRLQACRVAQVAEAQCDEFEAQLAVVKARCVAESFTAQAILQAENYGAGQVNGKVDNSPLRKQQKQLHWEREQMKPNVQNFYQYFPAFRESAGRLEELFHTGKCPNAYEGASNRWLLAEKRAALQQSFGPDFVSEREGSRVSIWFFMPAVDGQCYAPVAAGDNEPKVVNIPQSIVDSIANMSGNRVILCSDKASCIAEVADFERRYDEYQQYYSAYRRLADCFEQGEILATLGRALKKIGARNHQQADVSSGQVTENCPDYNLETKLLNVKGYLLELDNQLFQPVTNHS